MCSYSHTDGRRRGGLRSIPCPDMARHSYFFLWRSYMVQASTLSRYHTFREFTDPYSLPADSALHLNFLKHPSEREGGGGGTRR